MRRDVLGCYQRWREEYGPAVLVRVGPLRNAVFYSPEAVVQVLKQKAGQFRRYPPTLRVLSQWNGQSVLILEGQSWLQQRRLLSPAFRPQQLGDYSLKITRAINGCFPQAHQFELRPSMVRLALRMLCATIFGLEDEDAPLADVLEELAAIGMTEFFLPFPVPAWLPIPFARRKRAAIAALRGFVEHLIEQRTRQPGGGDLLAALLSAPLKPTQLRDEVMTLMLAGHDTTAAGLTWLLYFLATHPEVAERVAAEGRGLPEQPQLSHLGALRYSEQVVRETLRLFPPAPTVFLRQATEAVEIAGFSLQPGTLVHLPSMVIQRDPLFFPDPLRFDPDRWSPENVRHPEWSYFPFGGGPRVCLGQSFAMLEMTLTAAVLMARYRIELNGAVPAPPPARLRVSLWPDRPLWARLLPRTD